MPKITLEHTSCAADLLISKGCKFFDGDGGKIFKSNCKKFLFYVQKKLLSIKVVINNPNLAHQTAFCNHTFRFFPVLTEVCKHLTIYKQKACQNKKKPFQYKTETAEDNNWSKFE